MSRLRCPLAVEDSGSAPGRPRWRQALAAVATLLAGLTVPTWSHAEPDARGTGFSAAPGAAAAAAPAAHTPRPRKVIVEPPPSIPDPTATHAAAEANLRSNAERHGLALGGALVAWQQISTIDGADRGGGVALRLGATATPSTVVYLELFGGGFLNIAHGTAGTTKKDSYIESSVALMVSAQTYVEPNLWLRGGAGFASYTQVVPDPDVIDMPETRVGHGGIGAVTAIGVDVVRWRTTRMSLEAIQSLQRFSSGWLFNLGFGLGLSYY